MTSSSDGRKDKKSSGRTTVEAGDPAMEEWCIQTGAFGAATPQRSAATGVAHSLGYDPYSSADAVKTVNKLKAP
jgi:hypothetical protein